MTVSTTHLGKVVDVSAGQPAPKPNDFSEDGYPFIRAGSLEGLLSDQTEDDCEKIDAETARRYRMRLYPKDTILFAKSGMSAKIGRVYRMRQPAYVVSHLAALAPIGKYEPSYLAHWLRAHPPSQLIKDDAYPSIRTSEVSSLEVPNLHIDEQRRIAAILDKADVIRRKREQALALADDFLRSVFAEMFFGGEAKWPFVKVSSVAELINGDRSSNYPSGIDIVGSGILFVSTKNIVQSKLNLDTKAFITRENFISLSRGKLRRNDLIITLRGSVGQAAIFDCEYETGFINAQLMILRPTERILSEYLLNLFTHPTFLNELLSSQSGSAVPQLTAGQIGRMDIPLPPISVQRRFADVCQGVTKLLQRLRQDSVQADLLFSSLSQRAFRDELRIA